MSLTRLPTDAAGATVHNARPATTAVRVVVGREGGVGEALELAPEESHTVAIPDGAYVEVHTEEGTAAAPAAESPLFVVRDGRVLVVPE